MMGEPWMWIAGVMILGGLAVALVWAALRHPRRISVESARKLFHLQRERLEFRFFVLASQTGKPRGLEWIVTQMIESFMASPHVEEIFADDAVLRKRIVDVLKRHMMVDEEMDAEVRRRIKNLEEGTATWDVEYQKALEQIRRNRGLE